MGPHGHEYVDIARSMGVVASNAAHYYEAFTLHDDGMHFAVSSIDEMVKMDVEIVQASFMMAPSDDWLARFAAAMPEAVKHCPSHSALS